MRGKIYRYAEVPHLAYKKFCDAKSAGKHYYLYFTPFFKQAA